MSNPIHIVTVISILKYQNEYLLVQRSKNDDILPSLWQNLGGKVEEGERIEFALRREIKEEVGLDIDENQHPIFVQSYSWKKDQDSPYRMGIVFLFELDRKPEIKVSDELENYGWFKYEDVLKLETIGMKSETGTIAQIKMVRKLISIK